MLTVPDTFNVRSECGTLQTHLYFLPVTSYVLCVSSEAEGVALASQTKSQLNSPSSIAYLIAKSNEAFFALAFRIDCSITTSTG